MMASMTVSPFDRDVPEVSPVAASHLARLSRRQEDAALILGCDPGGTPGSQGAALQPSRSAARAPIYSVGAGAQTPPPFKFRTSAFMINEVYNRRILELAGSIPRLGRLATPDASATAHSKLCGSTVTVDLKMDGDTVTDFAHEVKACALGQASSSIMARNVVGAKADELRSLRETVRRMLKDNGAPPVGKWADIAVLEPVRDYKARHASTLLTFDAVVSAIDQIESKRRVPAAAAAAQ
jgi:NifU-like protein involved in Fe-S cluster formation